MEYLLLILEEMYPNKSFRLTEIIEVNKMGIMEVGKNDPVDFEGYRGHYFELYIDDLSSETFESLEQMEDYIFNLYKIETVKDAEEIIRENKNE